MKSDNIRLLETLELIYPVKDVKVILGRNYSALASHRKLLLERHERHINTVGPPCNPYRVYENYDSFSEACLHKEFLSALRRWNLSRIHKLLVISQVACRRIDSNILSRIRAKLDNLENIGIIEEKSCMLGVLDKIQDPSNILQAADKFYDEGEYLKAYNHYRMAGKLNRKLVDDIILKLYSEGSTLSLLHIVLICEEQKLKHDLLGKIGQKLLRNRFPPTIGYALTCYYILDDKKMISRIADKLRKENEG